MFLGFIQSQSDGALFILFLEELGFVIFLCYVDDIQIAAEKLSTVNIIKKKFLSKFPGKDASDSQFFLQMTMHRNRSERTVHLKQQLHIEKLIEQHNLQDSWPVSTPMITNDYKVRAGSVITNVAAISQYKSIVVALLHIANNTRPDIAFSVSYLARFTAKPTCGCFARIRDVLLYLKGTASYGLRLGGHECVLHEYCDSNWAGCPQSRKSNPGFVIKCGWGSIPWKSVKQATVSRSSLEAEYIAAGEVTKEVQYFFDMAIGPVWVPQQLLTTTASAPTPKGALLPQRIVSYKYLSMQLHS